MIWFSAVLVINEVSIWAILVMNIVRSPVIHLPARPASQTHNFPKRRTSLVLHASIGRKKLWMRSRLIFFSSLITGQDAALQIRIFCYHPHKQSFFPHRTEKLCHISNKVATLQPQKHKFRREEKFFSPKTATKTLQFRRLWRTFNLQAFDGRAWKLVSWKLPGY